MLRQGVTTIGFILLAGLVVLISFKILLPFLGYNAAVKENDKTIEVREVNEDPEIYSGLDIDIEGKITDWVSKKSFVVQGEREEFLNNPTILVISNKEFTLTNIDDKQVALGEDVDVKINGKVFKFSKEELIKKVGNDYNEDEILQWEDQPVIVIDSIEKS